ncbi:MAG: ABC transporter permease [Bacillota bacterium]
MIFWTFLFPILLATFFNLAFANLFNADSFSEIKIGIIDNEEFRENTSFVTAIQAVSAEKGNTNENSLFVVTYTSKAEAAKLLAENKVEGYIHFDGGPELVVKQSGLNQTIIKSFLDDYQQLSSTITAIIKENPAALQQGLLANVFERVDYLQETPMGRGQPDAMVIPFYALIAMACLYGGFFGLKEIVALQADLSPEGARVNVAPIHKLRLFTASMFAAITVLLVEILILLAYLIFVLKINFGNQFGFIMLTSIVGTVTGVTFGAFIAAVVKTGEGLKIGIIISLTMTMCFLSGMMYDKIKYIISSRVPLLGYLNPLNLITDSFYALYFYDSYGQYYLNIGLLCAFCIFFSSVVYLVLRRRTYASL